MTHPALYGITVPFDRIPLSEHRPILEEARALGYTDLWSSEASGTDGFTPLALAAAWLPDVRLGTAIVPSFTRGPATLAMSEVIVLDVMMPKIDGFALLPMLRKITHPWPSTSRPARE
jgi:CheY-like chemotaxis protein